MKKLAQLMRNHLSGKPTKVSNAFFKKIAQNLEDEGFKPPFEMGVKMYSKNRLDPTTRNILNKEITAITTPDNQTRYFDEIPLQDIIDILEQQGLTILQEDNAKWDGLLMGGVKETAETEFTLGSLESAREEPYGVTYEPIVNATLRMSWYKMPESGRYEIVAYVT